MQIYGRRDPAAQLDALPPPASVICEHVRFGKPSRRRGNVGAAGVLSGTTTRRRRERVRAPPSPPAGPGPRRAGQRDRDGRSACWRARRRLPRVRVARASGVVRGVFVFLLSSGGPVFFIMPCLDPRS